MMDFDEKKIMDKPSLEEAEKEAPEEIFLDPWLDHVEKAKPAGAEKVRVRNKKVTVEMSRLKEPDQGQEKASERKGGVKKIRPKRTSANLIKPEALEKIELSDGPLGETTDDNELELINQAGLFFWRGASPMGREKILRASRLRRQKLSLTAAEYLVNLRRNPQEWDEIWDLVDSDKDDSFFRFPAQFDLLAELLAEKALMATTRELRFLSAGCGPGFEAYSLSMFLRDQRLMDKGWDLKIDAYDLSEKLVNRARLGNFKASDLEWLRPEAAKSWFTFRAAGWHFKFDRGVKIEFYNYNPADSQGQKRYDFLAAYDFIFCRGLSFDCPDHRVKYLAKEMAGKLAPGGIIFTAPGEIWPEVSGLRLEERDGVIYGRRVELNKKPKMNLFFRKSPTKSRGRMADKVSPNELKANPRRESLIESFRQTIGLNPDAARNLVLEILAQDLEGLYLDPAILSFMVEVEAALGRDESAAAIESVLRAGLL
ncbi:MAG: hypothetical protein LBE80_06340 [Deltaproteobacteria bacterium]|jgi:chemotaxis methyl-accepting protein methylase|nr:hypothetical protein [Deltaproteobacteria bacterium]